MVPISRPTAIPKVLESIIIKNHKLALQKFYANNAWEKKQQSPPYLSNPDINLKIIDKLRRVFFNKCVYCETSLSREEGLYDHFRPFNYAKGFEKKEVSPVHYWWLKFDWENLYLSCEQCNLAKSTWFPVEGKRASYNEGRDGIINEKKLLIDPCVDIPAAHLSFNEQGVAVPLTNLGQTSITIFNLNRRKLVEERQEIIISVKNLFDKIDKRKPGRNKFNLLFAYLNLVFNSSGLAFQGAAQAYSLSRLFRNNKRLYNYFKYYGGKIKRRNEKKFITDLIEIIDSHEDRWAKKIKPKFIGKSSNNNIYIDKIIIKNFKGISKLEIKYPEVGQNNSLSRSKGEPWLIILGENGVGKSSILQAIVLTLAGQQYVQTLKIRASDFLKKGQANGYVRIEFRDGRQPAELYFSKQTHFLRATARKPLTTILGYGSTRLMPGGIFKPELNKGAIRAKNLFHSAVALIDYKKWLFNLPQLEFDRVCRALKMLLMLTPKDLIIKDKKNNVIAISSSGHSTLAIPISLMSDGYKSVLVLVVDIMEKLFQMNKSIDVAEGIVVIDEIGTHLHPQWRMRVVNSLRSIFPKVQFIVSTHDPLCLKGSKAGEVIVLVKKQSNVIIPIENLPDPSALRVDQLLTSEFFGLNSTTDPEIEELFNEYYYLLAKRPKSRSKIQEKRLDELSKQLKGKNQMGDSQRQSMMYKAIDNAIVDMRYITSGNERNRIKLQTEEKLQGLLNRPKK